MDNYKSDIDTNRTDRFSTLYVIISKIALGCVVFFFVGLTISLVYVLSDMDYFTLNGQFRTQRFFTDDGYYYTKQLVIIYGLFAFMLTMFVGPVGKLYCMTLSWVLSYCYISIFFYMCTLNYIKQCSFLMGCIPLISFLSHSLLCSVIFVLFDPNSASLNNISELNTSNKLSKLNVNFTFYNIISFVTGYFLGFSLLSLVFNDFGSFTKNEILNKNIYSNFNILKIMSIILSISTLSSILLTINFLYKFNEKLKILQSDKIENIIFNMRRISDVLILLIKDLTWMPFFKLSKNALSKIVSNVLYFDLLFMWFINPSILSLIPYTIGTHFEFHTFSHLHKMLFSIMFVIILLIFVNEELLYNCISILNELNFPIFNIIYTEGSIQLNAHHLTLTPISTTPHPNYNNLNCSYKYMSNIYSNTKSNFQPDLVLYPYSYKYSGNTRNNDKKLLSSTNEIATLSQLFDYNIRNRSEGNLISVLEYISPFINNISCNDDIDEFLLYLPSHLNEQLVSLLYNIICNYELDKFDTSKINISLTTQKFKSLYFAFDLSSFVLIYMLILSGVSETKTIDQDFLNNSYNSIICGLKNFANLLIEYQTNTLIKETDLATSSNLQSMALLLKYHNNITIYIHSHMSAIELKIAIKNWYSYFVKIIVIICMTKCTRNCVCECYRIIKMCTENSFNYCIINFKSLIGNFYYIYKSRLKIKKGGNSLCLCSIIECKLIPLILWSEYYIISTIFDLFSFHNRQFNKYNYNKTYTLDTPRTIFFLIDLILKLMLRLLTNSKNCTQASNQQTGCGLCVLCINGKKISCNVCLCKLDFSRDYIFYSGIFNYISSLFEYIFEFDHNIINNSSQSLSNLMGRFINLDYIPNVTPIICNLVYSTTIVLKICCWQINSKMIYPSNTCYSSISSDNKPYDCSRLPCCIRLGCCNDLKSETVSCTNPCSKSCGACPNNQCPNGCVKCCCCCSKCPSVKDCFCFCCCCLFDIECCCCCLSDKDYCLCSCCCFDPKKCTCREDIVVVYEIIIDCGMYKEKYESINLYKFKNIWSCYHRISLLNELCTSKSINNCDKSKCKISCICFKLLYKQYNVIILLMFNISMSIFNNKSDFLIKKSIETGINFTERIFKSCRNNVISNQEDYYVSKNSNPNKGIFQYKQQNIKIEFIRLIMVVLIIIPIVILRSNDNIILSSKKINKNDQVHIYNFNNKVLNDSGNTNLFKNNIINVINNNGDIINQDSNKKSFNNNLNKTNHNVINKNIKNHLIIFIFSLISSLYLNIIINNIYDKLHLEYNMWSYLINIIIMIGMVFSLFAKHYLHFDDFLKVLDNYGYKMINSESLSDNLSTISELDFKHTSKWILIYNTFKSFNIDLLSLLSTKNLTERTNTFMDIKNKMFPYKEMSKPVRRIVKTCYSYSHRFDKIKGEVLDGIGIPGEYIDIISVLDFLSYSMILNDESFKDQYESYFSGDETYMAWVLGKQVNNNTFLAEYYRHHSLNKIESEIKQLINSNKEKGINNLMLIWKVFSNSEIELISFKSICDNMEVQMIKDQRDTLKKLYYEQYLKDFYNYQQCILDKMFNVKTVNRYKFKDIMLALDFFDILNKNIIDKNKLYELTSSYFNDEYNKKLTSMSIPTITCNIKGDKEQVKTRIKEFCDDWLEHKLHFCNHMNNLECEKAVNVAYNTVVDLANKSVDLYEDILDLIYDTDLDNVYDLKQSLDTQPILWPVCRDCESISTFYINQYLSSLYVNIDKMLTPLGMYLSWHGNPIDKHHLHKCSHTH